jgi:outer membrane lipoprotein-sorting protein
METLYKEGTGSFIEMTAPARSRGLRFLEKGDSLYMYNPKSNSRRPLRLSPEQSFQGTVFSNNDVSDQQYTDDYSATLEDEIEIEHPDFGTLACRILNAVAKRPEAPYGRIEIYIDMANLRPLRFDYYAKSGMLFKSMLLKDYRQMAGKLRPGVMHMDSFELDGAWSEVIIESMEALDDIPDSRFTTASLTR